MNVKSERSLAERLKAIEDLESEIIRKSQAVIPAGSGMTVVDTFVFAAIKRTLSQGRAFRMLLEDWNFASAAVIVRTQLDTAMRINGVRFMEDVERDVAQIFNGEKIFRQLKPKGEKKNVMMTDDFLKRKLSEDHEWVAEIYRNLSDFVHLSFRHVWPSVVTTDDETQMVYFVLSGQDAKRDEANYFEIADQFYEITKLTGILLIGLLMARHSPPPQAAREAGE